MRFSPRHGVGFAVALVIAASCAVPSCTVHKDGTGGAGGFGTTSTTETVTATTDVTTTATGADCLTSGTECTGVGDCFDRCCSTNYTTHSMAGVLHYFCS